MIRLLLAVKSCQWDWDRWYHSVIRNSWGRDVKFADLRFFMGGDPDPGMVQNDEIVLDVPDDYNSLPQKTKGILQWSIEKNYDFTFLCDTDTFIIPSKLIACGFEKYDYMGLIRLPLGVPFAYRAVTRSGEVQNSKEVYPWASGGYGYFLSKKAAQEIIKHDPDTWAEDMWVAQILNPLYNSGEIKICDAKNFENEVSWHFPAMKYKSGYDLKFGWLDQMYHEHKC